MRAIQSSILIILSAGLFWTSCVASKANIPQDIDDFVVKAQVNSANYTKEDWEKSVAEYEKLIEDYQKNQSSYSAEDKQRVANAMGRYHALLLENALEQSADSLKGMLIDLFSPEDIYHFELKENAWWYLNYGPSKLNGGTRPYNQRFLLRKMIQEADSIMATNEHGVSLRFGHETVLLPLACLLDINGLDYHTNNLEKLEQKGWWARQATPMAGNIQFVFYRKNAKDKDVVFKVLLNEQEATLPIQTDIAPYYHWCDFREYYLQKIEDYERQLKKH